MYSEEVAKRCGLIQRRIRPSRMQWFGHVKRDKGQSAEDDGGNGDTWKKTN